jgi:O-antigen ligase
MAIVVVASFSVGRRFLGAGLVALLPLSPFLVIGVAGLLANTGAVAALSRTGNDVVTATGRLYIWRPVISFLEHPHAEQLIGYGANGQVTSGVSASYAYLFMSDQTVSNPTTVTTHNIVLQTILDYGYIGLVVIGALVAVAVTRLWRASRRYPASPFPAVLALFTVIMLNGMTEALPSYTFLDVLVPVLVIMGISCTELASPRPRLTTAVRTAPALRTGRAPVRS